MMKLTMEQWRGSSLWVHGGDGDCGGEVLELVVGTR